MADEEVAGADVVLHYGFSLHAAYQGVKIAAFMQTRNADNMPRVRGCIAEFEKFIGYPEFSERAKKYGLA